MTALLGPGSPVAHGHSGDGGLRPQDLYSGRGRDKRVIVWPGQGSPTHLPRRLMGSWWRLWPRCWGHPGSVLRFCGFHKGPRRYKDCCGVGPPSASLTAGPCPQEVANTHIPRAAGGVDLKAIWKFPGLKEHLYNCLKRKFGVWKMVSLGAKGRLRILLPGQRAGPASQVFAGSQRSGAWKQKPCVLNECVVHLWTDRV